MIDNLSIAVNAFDRCILTSLSVDEILLPRYGNLFTNFRGQPLKVEVAPSRSKLMYSALFASLFALYYVLGIRLEQVYLLDAVDHLQSLCLL